jgi:hypothetical protein
MKVSYAIALGALTVLAAVWGAYFIGPSLQTPRWSVVLLIDDPAAAPSARIQADLARSGYITAQTDRDPIAWLDLRAADGQPFFLVVERPIASDAIQAHIERTGLARRTVFAAHTMGRLALDRPSARPQAPIASDAADVVPTLLRLIGLTPSLPLPGRALAG